MGFFDKIDEAMGGKMYSNTSMREEWLELKKVIIDSLLSEQRKLDALKSDLTRAVNDLSDLAKKSDKILLAEALMRNMEIMEPKFFITKDYGK